MTSHISDIIIRDLKEIDHLNYDKFIRYIVNKDRILRFNDFFSNLLLTLNETSSIKCDIPEKLISKIFCEPNLGKRNLYPKISEKNNNFKDPQKLLDVMQFADGTNSDYQISKLMKTTLNKTKKLIKVLLKNNLIEYVK